VKTSAAVKASAGLDATGGIGGQIPIGDDAADRAFPSHERDLHGRALLVNPHAERGHRRAAWKPSVDDVLARSLQNGFGLQIDADQMRRKLLTIFFAELGEQSVFEHIS
jgi:hypothetical protein